MRRIIDWAILSLLILCIALFIIKRFYLLPSATASYNPPEIYPAQQEHGYYIKVTFDDPAQLYNRQLNGKVSCAKSETELGEFKVKDIRIWKPDDTRIIGDKFIIDCQPQSIQIWQMTDNSNIDLYKGDISTSTLAPIEPTIKSNLLVSTGKL